MFVRSPKHFKVGKQFLVNSRTYYYLEFHFIGVVSVDFFFKLSTRDRFNFLAKTYKELHIVNTAASHYVLVAPVRVLFDG